MKNFQQDTYNILNNARNELINIRDELILQINKAYDEGKADTPFTDTEEAENKAYSRGLNDAWEAARKIIFPINKGGYSFGALDEMFGVPTVRTVFELNNASEAIQKIKAYEDKQKQDAEIKVGDEIRLHDATEVVTQVMITGLQTIDASGNTSTWYYATYPLEAWEKTGRHFPQIAEVLKELRGAENDND